MTLEKPAGVQDVPPVPSAAPEASKPVPEIGGRPGPDPVRYGDWEIGGRCVDF